MALTSKQEQTSPCTHATHRCQLNPSLLAIVPFCSYLKAGLGVPARCPSAALNAASPHARDRRLQPVLPQLHQPEPGVAKVPRHKPSMARWHHGNRRCLKLPQHHCRKAVPQPVLSKGEMWGIHTAPGLKQMAAAQHQPSWVQPGAGGAWQGQAAGVTKLKCQIAKWGRTCLHCLSLLLQGVTCCLKASLGVWHPPHCQQGYPYTGSARPA